MTIPQEALEAANNAFQHPNRMLVNTSDGNSKGRLEAAFEAAEPYLRAKWAEELERAMFKVESVHQFGFGYHGFKCLCGFETLRNRSRTEHITQAVRNLLEGDVDECQRFEDD